MLRIQGCVGIDLPPISLSGDGLSVAGSDGAQKLERIIEGIDGEEELVYVSKILKAMVVSARYCRSEYRATPEESREYQKAGLLGLRC